MGWLPFFNSFLAMENNKIINQIVKGFTSERVIKFSDKDGFEEVKSWAHTGSPSLDYNLQTHGLPTGIIEIAGKSRSGKTTLGLMAMKHFLNENKETGIACILSSENRDNKDYALQLGVDVSRVIIIKIHFVEEMFLMVRKFIENTNTILKQNGIKEQPRFFFMWDSLGATIAKAELDAIEHNQEMMQKQMEKGDDIEKLKSEKIGAFAKNAKMFAKSLTALMYTNIIHFVILNHQYDTIGSMGISVRKSTGGEWVEYLPTLRLSMKLVKNEKIDDVDVAQISEVKVVKNDYGSRVPTNIRILLGYGIILSNEDIQYALELGILQKEGVKKIQFMNGKLKWGSPRELFQLYREDNKFLRLLIGKIRQSMRQDLLDYKNKLKSK